MKNLSKKPNDPIRTDAIDRLRRLGDDTDGVGILVRVIEKFRQEAVRWSGEIRSALTTGDLALVRRIAHTLCGSAAVLGATRLVEICAELESVAVSGDAKGCHTLLPSFDESLSEVLSALAKVEQHPAAEPYGR